MQTPATEGSSASAIFVKDTESHLEWGYLIKRRAANPVQFVRRLWLGNLETREFLPAWQTWEFGRFGILGILNCPTCSEFWV
jgi:hypothetical protein